ncbi:MAG: prepilin-type N-terminal cleavage/methylation domain-containing protein [Candidatus Omnitrophota bacterium]
MKFNASFGGFTLIELIIAVTVFSVVILTVYLSFGVGIRAWREAEGSYKLRQQARQSLDIIGRELRNAVNFAPIQFEGGKDWIRFASSPVARDSDSVCGGVFEMEYFIEEDSGADKSAGAAEKSLYRICRTYKESLQEDSELKKDAAKSLLISGLSGFKLRYARREDENIIWVDNWEKDNKCIPFGVELSLIFASSRADETPIVFSEIILMPTGVLKEIEALAP